MTKRLRQRILSLQCPSLLVALLFSMAVVGCGQEADNSSLAACDPNDGGLQLPDGFCATVVGDTLGPTRHLAVAENGDVYAALDRPVDGHGIVALRDTTGDYAADRVEYFGDAAGSGLRLHNGYLYFGPHTAVWRYARQPGELIPSGDREVVVTDFPEQSMHDAKSITFDGAGHLYVSVGAPSNACMEERRKKGSLGQDPCPELETSAGIWQTVGISRFENAWCS